MTIAYVGLGSNQEDPERQIEKAFSELDRMPQSRILKRSSLYRTAPLGFADQPPFVNAVAQLETGISAERLLAELRGIEARHGRARTFPNAPRTLDLDLLLFEKETINKPGLVVPHPRMHERAFVLEPLLEIAPDIAIPGIGPARACRDACLDQPVQRLGG